MTPVAAALRRGWREALIPLAILVLRLIGSPMPFYIDWVVILSVYWLLFVFLSETKAMPAVTAAVVISLFAIYMIREFGLVLDTINLCR